MDVKLHRAADMIIVTFGALASALLFAKYALGALIPIILGALIASFIRPVATPISKASKIPLKVISAILVILIFVSLATIAFYTISRLSLEIKNLIERLSEDKDILNKAINTLLSKPKELFGKSVTLQDLFNSEQLQRIGFDLDSILIEMLTSLLSTLTGYIPSAAVNLATKIPETLLFVIVSVLSAHYLCCDREKILSFLFSIIPQKTKAKITDAVKKSAKALRGCLKAYFLIMLLTFFELFVGFSVLGVNYSLFLALIIALIDIMPILGTGTVIIPWSLFCFATGDRKLGVGLAILYAITLIIRQITEPKIIGSTLGLHPLAALISTYIGIKLFGFSGVFIGPLAATAIGIVMSASGIKKCTTSDATF